jgi:PAS domain S-box-containing protein
MERRMRDGGGGVESYGASSNLSELAAQAAVMRRLAESLSRGLDLEKACKVVVDLMVDVLGAHNCSLYLVDHLERHLILASARGIADSESSFYPDGGNFRKFALGEGICGKVAEEGKPRLIADVRGDPQFIPTIALVGEIRSLLSVPLIAGEIVVGVINVSHPDIGAFGESNEALLSLVSSHAGIALSNVQLYTSLSDAHARLEVSERRLRELFARANDAILIIDSTGHVVDANEKWESFAGVPRDNWDDISVESPSAPRLSLKEFLRREAFVREGTTLEAAIIRPDGFSSVVEISSKAFPFEEQELCLVLLRDVTERKRLAEQLIKTEKLAAIGEVTAALAHEVNNPLGALYNAVCLLKRDLKLSGDNGRLLEVAVEEAAHLSEIVNDFLSFARFPHSRFDWTDLNEQVSNALFLMKRDERMGPHIEVSTELATDLAAAQVDRAQFQEILFNLISNALDAMEDGGRLAIKTYNARLGDHSAVGLIVSDSGGGIPEEILDKVFAPFFTTKEIGTGLGLSIVKRIVEEHQGSVSIDSAVGMGTRVSVVLPVSREDVPWHQYS